MKWCIDCLCWEGLGIRLKVMILVFCIFFVIDVVVDEWVDIIVVLVFMFGIYIGCDEVNDCFGDFSFVGYEEIVVVMWVMFDKLFVLEFVDVIDEVIKIDLSVEFCLDFEFYQVKWYLCDFNVIVLVVQDVCFVFDLMLMVMVEDWDVIVMCLVVVFDVFWGYVEMFWIGIVEGVMFVCCQVIEVVLQIDWYMVDDGFFVVFVVYVDLEEGQLLVLFVWIFVDNLVVVWVVYGELCCFFVEELVFVVGEVDVVGCEFYVLNLC